MSRPEALRLRQVKLVAFDVDGVLTDGGLYFSGRGGSSHAFHVRDGLALVLAVRAKLHVAVISGRRSAEVAARLRELRISRIHQAVVNKTECLQRICSELDLRPNEVAFVGDDVNDLPALRWVGLPVTVADGAPEVQEEVRRREGWVLDSRGGHGAAREFLQALLEAGGRWLDEPSAVL
jgi:3-deoxy-D-manno-octulosonate 8-phosphate phosphatase (KDO 8-P phosphatase)